MWLRSDRSGRLVQVGREQLRSAVGYEQWSPNEYDLRELRKAERDLRKEEYEQQHARPHSPACTLPAAALSVNEWEMVCEGAGSASSW